MVLSRFQAFDCGPGLETRVMLSLYAVISQETQSAVELFSSREQAEAMIQEVNRDDPELATSLSVAEIEIEVVPN